MTDDDIEHAVVDGGNGDVYWRWLGSINDGSRRVVVSGVGYCDKRHKWFAGSPGKLSYWETRRKARAEAKMLLIRAGKNHR